MASQHFSLTAGLIAAVVISAPAFATESRTGTKLVVDGNYGIRTQEAVRLFQQRNGLKVDGIAGPETLKALGLSYERTQRRYTMGKDVARLQGELNSRLYMAPKPKPTIKPTPKPTPAPVWTPAPTPAPVWTPSPEPMETPEPWTPAPVVEPSEEPETWRPTLQVYGGDWMLPMTAGKTDFNYMFKTPVTWFAGGALWAGSWGLAGEYTAMPAMFVGASPVLPTAGGMYDGQLRWRSESGDHSWGLGYRGFRAAPGTHLGTLSYNLDAPLGADWFRFKLGALGGSNFGSGWMADGRASLGFVLGPITIDGGYRVFGFNNLMGATTTVTTHAPFAAVGLQF